MNQHKQSSDLDLGRGWLTRAAEMLDSCEDHRSDAEFARAAAAIGNGFIALAHAERAAASMAETSQVRQEILALSERGKRAEAEARPHDDEQKPPPCTGCFGPFADGTHGPGCMQRYQDCQGDPDGPLACRCRDVVQPHDEPKHAVDEGVVWIVADGDGPLHAAATQALAQVWAAENRDSYESLSVIAVAVDRG